MIRRIYRIQILIWSITCLAQLGLPILPVTSFTFSIPPTHHKRRSSRIHFSSSSTLAVVSQQCNRQKSARGSKLNSRREENEDEDVDDDYYYTPRPAKNSPESSRRATRQGKPSYTPYYKERSTDRNYGFQEPLRPIDDNQKLAPYSSQSNYDDDDDLDYDDDDDLYYNDGDEEEEEYREIDDDEEEPNGSLGGNFWSNPKGGIDRSMRPPSPPTPRLTSPRRRPVDTPGRSNSERRRRTPVRSSSLTQAPWVAKDFYERLFWYGFDPDESEQIGDKTVFGGTKGKFNGLAFLQASEVPRRPVRSRLEQQQQQQQQRRPLPPSRQSRRTRNDNDDDDEEEDQDDYYDYYDDDDGEVDDYALDDGRGNGPTRVNRRLTTTRTNVTPPADIPNPRNERRAIPSPPPPPRQRRKRPRPRGDDDFYGMDEEEEQASNGGDWISKQVSSWFSGVEDDDDEDDDDYRGERRSTGRQQRRRQRTGKDEWSPFNILDAFLGVNRDELAYKAEVYNSKMGIGPRRRSQRPTNGVSPQGQRRPRTRENRRRPGYAYRYDVEEEMEEDEGGFVLDVEPVTRQDSKSLDTSSANGSQAEKEKQQEEEEEESPSNNSRVKDLTWEERALAVERVPPADIPGWGPSGELPYDARTKAIMDALEDIQTARQKVEACEKKEALAKEEITILKVDAELQRRQLEESRTKARLAQERLRQIEMEIDDASRALRRARTRVRLARDRLEELQVRHWAVLGFYNPDQAEEKVAEALAAYRLSESIESPLGDLGQPQPSTTTSQAPPNNNL